MHILKGSFSVQFLISKKFVPECPMVNNSTSSLRCLQVSSHHQIITCTNAGQDSRLMPSLGLNKCADIIKKVNFNVLALMPTASAFAGTIWMMQTHDDAIKWKHFPRYWLFVRGIHRSPVKSPHKGQWRGALMFSLICARINGWVNNREAGAIAPIMTSS